MLPALSFDREVRTLAGKHNQGSAWRRRAFLGLLALFLLSGSFLLRDQIRARREQHANQALAQQVRPVQPQPQDGDSPDQAAPAAPDRERYQLLWEQNHDFAGWLTIEGTVIDYPVMFTPEDPEFYLRRAFDGSEADSGSLFIGEGCQPEGSHVIIYGHHMKNGTMFGSLTEYQDPAYWEAHPVIRYDTLDSDGEYQVLAAFYSRVYRLSEEQVFRYYQYADLEEPDRFAAYVAQAQAASLYDTGVSAEYGDRLLTLSTCSYHTKNGRFVVVAVKKAA